MRYFLWFWFTVIRRACSIIYRRKKETKRAYALLGKIETRFKGRFNPATRKKIAVSYGIYLPMLCDAFTRLRGRHTTAAEKERFIYYFICSSLFDDFTDYHLISKAQLYAISFQYADYTPKTFDEEVFRFAHRLLRDFVEDKESYDQVSRALFDAQMRSQKQYQSDLGPDALRAVTFAKGGYAVLLCSYYLNAPAEARERECWYKIGTLIQLTNDLYDIHKDLQDDLTTLPNSMKDPREFEAFFVGEIQKMKQEIRRLPFALRRKRAFSLSMAGVYAFGLIAIDQLKRIQDHSGGLPDLHSLPRNKLVIDMEKAGNLLLWFRFTYRYARLEKSTA